MIEGKQVKVDNWGIFFLQRLHQFYNKTFFCDLTLQFEDNVQIKVHRLVMNACTEYFQMLEKKCEMNKDCLMMPSTLPSDVVLPIINFMYSGILEFHESLFDRLYATAKLMNMSVLTKLLDAQKTPVKPMLPLPKRVQSVTPITWNFQGKKLTTKNMNDVDLPETLPGRKLPIWKRKSIPNSVSYVSASSYESFSPKVIKTEDPPKPTRFEWPEEESSFENSFDEISYTSKPLIMPSVISLKDSQKSPKPSTSSFDEIKKSGPVKRAASPVGNQCKKVNIQDVEEYLKEHKIRSDFIDYDDSETTDNDLQTYEDTEECSKDASDVFQQITDENPNKSILKTDTSASPSNKHVRFSLEGKDIKKMPKTKDSVDMSKHTKIITEVLKKYPHLVKNNKNIRLKILAKGNNSKSSTKTQINQAKPTSKVSYMVMKPDKIPGSDKDKNSDSGPWKCTRCEEHKVFTSYHIYRQHLTEAHNEKQDSQMCILCGHICRKQNMLVYHKYVKHNVPPPAMYHFPKCKECNYIALSQALLNKHLANHTQNNLNCAQCDSTFANKQLFMQHVQQTGHSQDKSVTPQFSCNLCDKHFFSENILNTHIKRSHEKETAAPHFNCNFCDKKFFSENILNSHIKQQHENEIRVSPQYSCSLCDKKFFSENILNTHIKKSHNKELERLDDAKKDKIKILSDVKVSEVSNAIIPVHIAEVKQENAPLEPSSEAEALSNVASGIAASLGLVDTIVVLDDNQFILQSSQQNLLSNNGQDYIIPAISDISAIANTQSVTNTDAVLTQTHPKSNIASTDELVMVLTDHDYSDAVTNTVMSDNNIVVLYSHPVQTQAMMINSETGLIEMNKNYAVTSELPEQVVHCEESIEMIQQEINNHLEENPENNPEYLQSEYIQQDVAEYAQEYQVIGQDTYQVKRTELLNEAEQIEENIEKEQVIEIELNSQSQKEIEVQNDNIQELYQENQTELIQINTNVYTNTVSESEQQDDSTQDINIPEDIQEEIQEIDDQQEAERMETNLQVEEGNSQTETTNDLNIEEKEKQAVEATKEEIIKEKTNEELMKENIQMTVDIQIAEENKEELEENSSQMVQQEIIPQYAENTDGQSEETEQMDTQELRIIEENKETEGEESETQYVVTNTEEIEKQQEEVTSNDQTDTGMETEIVSQCENTQIEITQDAIQMETENVEPMETENVKPLETQESNQKFNVEEESIKMDTQELVQETNETQTTDINKDDKQEIETEQSDSQTETEPTIVESPKSDISVESPASIDSAKTEQKNVSAALQNEKISQLLNDWDDGDTDSQQSYSKTNMPAVPNTANSINKLIDDWEDEEET